MMPKYAARTHAPVPNTLGVPCIADELVEATSEAELLDALADANRRTLPVTVLGGGSNVVLHRRIPGMTIMVRMRGFDWQRRGEGALVRAAAGESWGELVRASLGRGIAGLENLAGIPGAVGGAPFQNIGAYGRELAELVETVTAVHRQTLDVVEFDRDDCAFGYRDSRFKSADRGRYIVTAVTLRLGNSPLNDAYADVYQELCRMGRTESAVAIAEAVLRVRRRKLPDVRTHPNAGSFFKNPVLDAAELDRLRARIDIAGYPVRGADERAEVHRIPAARLIDAAGWKPKGTSRVAVWQRQPLVLVNRGGATGRDVLAFAERIRDDIERRFDLLLEREPMVLGTDRGA